MHTPTTHTLPDTYRSAANRLATAGFICSAILTLFLVASEEMLHWFVVPVFCCGVLICLDAVDWVTGRRDVFDPVGIIGALGLHVFFVAPLLHVHWQYWMRYVAQPPDWRPWLGLMACLNFGGLLVYRAIVSYMERHADTRPPARTRAVDFRRFPFAWAAGTAVAVAAQVVVFLRFGGIGGYVDAFESRSGAFEGMGLQFVVAESVPILAFIGYAVWVRRAGRLPSWAELATVLLCLVAMRLLFGGLRGSRSTTVWAIFWAVGIIHLWVRPLRRTIIVAGLVFLLAFMYVYGFYKAAGREGVRAVLTGSAEADELADRGNRSIETAILADLGRADVQAFLLYRLTRAGTDYQYAFGRTYFASAALFVPKSVWPDRPAGKRKEGTDALYGARSYVPGRLAASQVYGLAGEGMLNFGPWAAPVMFVPFGLLVGWAAVLRRKLPQESVYLLLYPLLVNLCFIVLVSDSDNVIVFLVKNALVPLVVVLTGSTLVATASATRAAAPPPVRGAVNGVGAAGGAAAPVVRARWGRRAAQAAER